MANLPDAILIAGPTAGGKSALALDLAAKTGGAIINCDSMQVYGGLLVLTARPDAQTMLQAEHHLYGHVPPSQPYSVAIWLKQAADVYNFLQQQKRPALFVGGTGLYFKALLEGISSIPAIEPSVRQHWRGVGDIAPETLHGELLKRDPVAAARLNPADRQRLVRALEVFDTAGRSIIEFQSAAGNPVVRSHANLRKIIVEPPRQVLHQRIEARFDAMLAQGALDEVEKFMALGLPDQLPAMKAIGLAPLWAHVSGKISLEEAVLLSKASTRQYAKRQSTWFRNQFGPEWERNPAAQFSFDIER